MATSQDSGRSAPGNPEDIMKTASGASWGEFAVYLDRELPAVVIHVQVDHTRGFEYLLTPTQALGLALRIGEAVQSLAELRAGPLRHDDRRKRFSGDDA